MSLLVWLPLQGTLKNNGIDNAIIQGYGVTADESGKLGKCYSFDGSDDYISISDKNLYKITAGTNPFSISMWVYHADSSRGILFGDYGLTGTVNFNVELTTGHILRFYWAANPDYTTTVSVGASTWSHVAITYDGSVLSVYLNGTLSKTRNGALSALNKSTGDFYIGRDSRTGTTALNGKLNDLRIYDHCLSVAEVKELSQGLAAHYKLDGFASGYGNPNILNNSKTFGTGWTSTGTTQTYTYNGFTVKYEDNSEKSSYTNMVVYSNATTVNPGEVYTGSFWAKSDSNQDVSCFFYNNTSGIVQVESGISSINTESDGTDGRTVIHLTPTWTRYWITWTFTSTGDAAAKTFLIRHPANGVGVYIAGIKLEKGNIHTGWAPSVTDESTAFSYVSDSSGYGHDGTINSTTSIVSDTCRYNNSMFFDGVDDCILIPFNEICPLNVFTFNIWFKKDSLGTKGYETLFGGPSGFEMDTRSGTATALSLYMASTRSGARNSVTSLSLGNWYMITMTRSDTKERYYVNGIFQSEIDAKSMPTGNYYIGSWKNTTSQNYYGMMSDFRIYNTVLSDSEVLHLYEVSQKIDFEDSIHSFDYVESTGISLSKNTTAVNTLSESKALSRLKYDTNVYIEPDGSAWIKIFHHNNPGAGSFNSTDNFEHSVYLDTNRWFNVEVCYDVTRWELMVKGKYTSTSDEWKVRWIQGYNPMTATFENVAVANVTKITGNGYSSTASTWGGLYAKKSSTYLSVNNGNSSNWWGAVGSYSVYQNGIPGWGMSATVTTTGFNDLYLRIDNLETDIPSDSQFKKSGIMTAGQFIEM